MKHIASSTWRKATATAGLEMVDGVIAITTICFNSITHFTKDECPVSK